MEYESTGYKIFKIINVAIMLFILVICLFPFLHVLAKAFNDVLDTNKGGITFYPRKFTLDNFKLVLGDKGNGSAAVISVLRLITGTLLGVFVSFTCAYALLKKDLRGMKTIALFLIFPMYFNSGLMMSYVNYKQLHLTNNFLVYILPFAFAFTTMLIAKTFMQTTIPISLQESARIDGAGEYTIFFKIYLPLCMPILAALGLQMAVFHWNDWTTTLYYASNNHDLATLQYKLMQVVRESQAATEMARNAAMKGQSAAVNITPETVRCAQIIIVTFPIVLLYPFLQKYFIKGMLIGAVKE